MRQHAFIKIWSTREVSRARKMRKSAKDVQVLSKLPKCFISWSTHSWYKNQLFYNLFNVVVSFKLKMLYKEKFLLLRFMRCLFVSVKTLRYASAIWNCMFQQTSFYCYLFCSSRVSCCKDIFQLWLTLTWETRSLEDSRLACSLFSFVTWFAIIRPWMNWKRPV